MHALQSRNGRKCANFGSCLLTGIELLKERTTCSTAVKTSIYAGSTTKTQAPWLKIGKPKCYHIQDTFSNLQLFNKIRWYPAGTTVSTL